MSSSAHPSDCVGQGHQPSGEWGVKGCGAKNIPYSCQLQDGCDQGTRAGGDMPLTRAMRAHDRRMSCSLHYAPGS